MPRSGWKRAKPSVITLADRARDAGQWDIAAAYYRTALQRCPENPPIWVQYGHVLKESGRLMEAEGAYRTALTYGLDTADTYVHLGHLLKMQGRTEEARTTLFRALMLNPA